MATRKRIYSAYDRAYQARPDEVKKREERNLARAHMKKKLGAAAIKGKDIDHVKPLASGGSASDSNLRVRSISSNRGDKSMFEHRYGK
jgi:hypothetical protein